MQKAVPVGVGAMAALLGLEFDVAQGGRRRGRAGAGVPGRNDNGGGQVVVSGDKAASSAPSTSPRARGAKRAMMLRYRRRSTAP